MMRRNVLGLIGRHLRCYSTVGNHEQKCESFRTNVAEELVTEFGYGHLVKRILKSRPELEQSDIYFWKTVFNALHKFGFHSRDCFHIIRLDPSVLACEGEQIEGVLNEWKQHSHLGGNDLKFLILNRPEFLKLSPSAVKYRVPQLLNYCQTKSYLMTLLFLCPNVMEENWEEIMRKIEFLNDEMVVYRTEVFSCKALSKSLHHIKLRFSILEKCGIYVRPNQHEHKQTHKERLKLKNPKLKDITDKMDYAFARKVAKISLEEYEVYAEAFDEYEEVDEDDDDDSSDEE